MLKESSKQHPLRVIAFSNSYDQICHAFLEVLRDVITQMNELTESPTFQLMIVEVNEEPALVEKFEVVAIPTVFCNERLIFESVEIGALNLDQLLISKFLEVLIETKK